jgi:hypothetical protein
MFRDAALHCSVIHLAHCSDNAIVWSNKLDLLLERFAAFLVVLCSHGQDALGGVVTVQKNRVLIRFMRKYMQRRFNYSSQGSVCGRDRYRWYGSGVQ